MPADRPPQSLDPEVLSSSATDTGQRALAVRVISQPASGGGLTDAQLRATPVPVADGGGTLTVDGTVSVGNIPHVIVDSMPAGGSGLTDSELRASPVPVSASSLPIPSGAATSAKQPALGTAGSASSDVITVQGIASMTALKVDGSAVTQPVSGTFWQATQPVSGPLTDAQLRASAVPVSLSTLPALVAGTSNIGDVDVVTLPALTVAAAASSTPIGSVSLGNSLGKTLCMKTGTLVTTAVTADQVILTYTVTSGKTFYLMYMSVNVRLTTFAATATHFGTASLESPAGTKLLTRINAGAGVGDAEFVTFPEPLPIAAGTVIRIVCTPSATTSMTWIANFGGYEK